MRKHQRVTELAIGMVLRVATLLLLSLPVAHSQTLQFASLGDFSLESGEVILECRLGYRTFGRLNAEKSNAVLFPTWFTGTTASLVALIGPGKLIDSAKHYVIAVDALGDGVSSSPSNSQSQPRMKFPRFSIRDMVNSQHRLLTEALKISHLRAVMGISMGGMQTFQWMVSYPDFMDRAVPIVGSPQLTSYDLLLWEAELRAIEADRDWNHGDYSSPPAAALRTVADIHALALYTPEYRASHTEAKDFSGFLAATEESTIKGFDANNRVRQLEAMMGHDVMKPFAGSRERAAAVVRAKVLVVVGLRDHMVNPGPALAFARLLHAETQELDSDCGHIAPTCEQRKVAAAIDRFL